MVPGRLRPRIFSTFGTTRAVDRQPYAPAAFTPGEIPVTHFQRLSRPQGTWFCRKESQVTPPGIDPGTVRLVAQRLNHYATPGPVFCGSTQYIVADTWIIHKIISKPLPSRSLSVTFSLSSYLVTPYLYSRSY